MSTNVFVNVRLLLKMATYLIRGVDYPFRIFQETGEKDWLVLHSFKVL
jgi:hypothetical protein